MKTILLYISEAKGSLKNVVDAFPSDFVEYSSNQVNFGDHKVKYTLIGETRNKYRQKVEITKDGVTKERIYTQDAEESCKYTFLENYEILAKSMGITPRSYA